LSALQRVGFLFSLIAEWRFTVGTSARIASILG
jgi:hypothetical protein